MFACTKDDTHYHKAQLDVNFKTGSIPLIKVTFVLGFGDTRNR